MKIEKDTVVTLRYRIADAEGKLIEDSRDAHGLPARRL